MVDVDAIIQEVYQFVSEAQKAGEAVLIHCLKGMSRSSTMVITYLMVSGVFDNCQEALSFVQKRHAKAYPN